MFWKRKREFTGEGDAEFDELTHRKEREIDQVRQCTLFISSKYKEIIFVPIGEVESFMHRELDSVVVKPWPMSIGELQEEIENTLNKYQNRVADLPPSNQTWYSLNASKAKSQRSFKVDYIDVNLFTDTHRPYGEGEVERIRVDAAPKDRLQNSYVLTGVSHLLETGVAQTVIDIFNACEKIRN
ncbi:MAG: hypothetical protein JJ975_00255 [Bacteroidia bacterium]|nr:hypothetical protein [Bacteroidia bacterium]